MSRLDCHTLPAGEAGSSISAPLVRGIVASSVAGAIIIVGWAYGFRISKLMGIVERCKVVLYLMLAN